MLGTRELNERMSAVTFVFIRFEDTIHETTQSLGPGAGDDLGCITNSRTGWEASAPPAICEAIAMVTTKVVRVNNVQNRIVSSKLAGEGCVASDHSV